MRPFLAALAVLVPGCVDSDGSYACGPVGAYLFCAPDEACVGVISFTGAEAEVWACAPDVGCDAPEDDYCDARATSARCEPTRADANDGSRPLVSVVRCDVPSIVGPPTISPRARAASDRRTRAPRSRAARAPRSRASGARRGIP